jgi:hypothetical protein
MQKYLLPGAALMSLVSGGASAAPTPIGTFLKTASTMNPAPAGSTGLGPLGPVGGIGGPYTFTAPFTGALIVKVQPAVGSFAGNVFQAFVDSKSLGFTPQVPLFGPHLSAGTFTTLVSAGINDFDVNDQLLSYIGSPPPFGSAVSTVTTVPAAFSPGGILITLAEALPLPMPEPRPLWTFAGALLAICFFWRRKLS